jgi:hypothetical protein
MIEPNRGFFVPTIVQTKSLPAHRHGALCHCLDAGLLRVKRPEQNSYAEPLHREGHNAKASQKEKPITK